MSRRARSTCDVASRSAPLSRLSAVTCSLASRAAASATAFLISLFKKLCQYQTRRVNVGLMLKVADLPRCVPQLRLGSCPQRRLARQRRLDGRQIAVQRVFARRSFRKLLLERSQARRLRRSTSKSQIKGRRKKPVSLSKYSTASTTAITRLRRTCSSILRRYCLRSSSIDTWPAAWPESDLMSSSRFRFTTSSSA